MSYLTRLIAILFICLISSLSAMAQNATIQDYWSGKAQWVFDRKYSFNDGPEWRFDSSIVRVVGSEWYLFSRAVNKSAVAGCPNGNVLSVVVRKSTDRGQTWSSPVTALEATDHPASICAATDGDAYFDANANRWRFLYQCQNTSQEWKGCYAERAGSSPLGKFTPVAQNPVIQPHSIWGQICNQSSDKCVQRTGYVKDEGTFNIFRFDGTFYWISFHGTDGAKGFRGIAKTKDFLTFYAGGSNGGGGESTPVDAVLSPSDAVSWREQWQNGNIGVGHGNIIEEAGMYYMLAESADTSLNCRPGQNWDFGLFRSASLTSLAWEQFPAGNPILYSSKDQVGDISSCNIQYAQIFRDQSSGIYYLHYSRNDADWNYRANYFFVLQSTNNVLKNGDLWMATSANWTRLPAVTANLAVYRYPRLSSDGTPILATNCGATACAPGQSIYQDVDVSSRRGRPYTFGGQFSATGGTGALSLVVWQLDASFNVLQSNAVPVAVSNGVFTNVDSVGVSGPPLVISNQTKYLRYQFYITSPAITYLADNMYINVN